MIKEYHFYVSDDHEHDMLFVQHCFGLIYDSFRNNGVPFTKKGFGHMGVQGSSNRQTLFIGQVSFISDNISRYLEFFLNKAQKGRA